MSLRPHDEQTAYETQPEREAWSIAVTDACRAAGSEPPTDLRWRWDRGESLDDIVREVTGRDAYRNRIIAEAKARDDADEAAGRLIRYRDHRITRGYIGWEYVHDEYDGDEDRRCGCALRSIEECKEEIDIWYEEQGE